MIETPAELPPLPPASDRSDLAVQPQGASKPPALSSAQANAFASQADADVSAYQYRQNGAAASRRMQAMAQYLGDSGFSTDLGMELEQSRQRLKSGETALGLLVVAVQKDSAASAAGIRPFKHGVHDALAGVAAATSVLVPVAAPLAMLAIPALDFFEVGESYDMIVGIDGNRVTSYADFIERLRNLQPGELIYLSIVRNGKRLQLSMPVPATTSSSMP
jgi:S1-C subfamily serine protease